MNLKKRLMATAAVFFITSVIIVCALIWVAEWMKRGFIEQGTYYSITEKVFALNVLSDRYVMYSNARAKQQLQQVHNSMTELLSQIEPGNADERALHEVLLKSHNRVKDLFGRLVMELESGSQSNSSEIVDRLSTGLWNELSIMSNAASSFFFSGQARLISIQRTVDLPLIVLICVMLLVNGFVSFRMGRVISSSLLRLRQGIDRARKGALEQNIKVEGLDEIADVARAFNQTAAELHSAYATLKKEIAERKRMNDELERKNQELQNFAFIASHDLNEPLRKIQTFGSLLEARSAVVFGDQERDYVSRMTGAAERMRELLDALLRYSRLDTSGKEFGSNELDDVVKETVGDLEISIRDAEARVEIDHLPTVDGDPYQLRQLFQNLIANAVKYRRPEVQPVIRIYGENNNGVGRIYVEDNGIGFDEKYLGKIFQPFQRLHGKNEYPGTGIGFAICKKIVERHGGTITATSTPGKGSTFIITLPVMGKR